MKWIGRLAELTEDWCHMIRIYGWTLALPQIGQKLLRLPYQHLRFFTLTCSLLEPLPDLEPKIDLQIRFIESVDLELLYQMNRPSEMRTLANNVFLFL